MFMALAGIIYAVYRDLRPGDDEPMQELLRRHDTVLLNLPIAAMWLWILLTTLLATMFVQYFVLYMPHVTESALMAGGVQDCEIKVHIDSGASRHCISDIILFASWDEDVPNKTIKTDVGTPITSKAVGTLKLCGEGCAMRCESCYPGSCTLHLF